jgi:hypothetical protein
VSRLPPGWRWSTVGEAGRIDLGRQRHPDWHTGPEMRPYLRVANVFEDRIDTSDLKEMDFSGVFGRYKLEPGDVLLNEGQSPELLGRPAIYRGHPENVAFTNTLLRFRAGPEVLPEWALIVFRRHMHYGRFAREARITTNIAHLSARRLKPVEFPVPPLAEQRRIVDILEDHLSRLDAAHVTLSTCQARNASLRDALLEDYLFNRPAGRGDVDFVSVGDVAAIDSGPAFKSRLFREAGDGTRLLRGDNIEPGHLRWSRTKTWPDELLPGYEHLMVSEGDIILAMDRPVVTAGLKIARVEPKDAPALLVQRVARIRPNPNVQADYLYAVLQSRRFIRQLLGSQVGTQIPHITLRGIREFRFPIPAVAEQSAIVDTISMVLDGCGRINDELALAQRRAKSLKRALLDAGFSGRLTGRASDMEIVEEMAGV